MSLTNAGWFPRCEVLLHIVFDGFGGDEASTTDPVSGEERAKPTYLHVTPIDATVNLNGYYEADTWDLSFNAQALPFHPDLIKSLAAEIHMYAARSADEDWHGRLTEQNLMIVGLADKATFDLSSDGRKFSCSGMDYTALFTGKQWDPKRPTPNNYPLDSLIRLLVSETHATAMTVVWESDEPVPQVTERYTFKDGKNYWDVMYRLAQDQGAVCVVRGDKVVLSYGRSLVARTRDVFTKAGLFGPRFKIAEQRDASTGGTRLRRMAWGSNLSSLKVERHIGREQTPQQVVRGFDRVNMRPIEAAWPEDATKTADLHAFDKHGKAKQIKQKRRKAHGTGTVKETVQITTVKSVHTTEQAQRYAKALYEAKTRGESKVMIASKSLRDLAGSNMLELRGGDPFSVAFDAFDAREMRQMTPAQREAYLLRRGYGREVARIVANGFELIHQFEKPFYCDEASFKFANESGIAYEATGLNYVSVPRDDLDAALPLGGAA